MQYMEGYSERTKKDRRKKKIEYWEVNWFYTNSC